VGIEGCCHGSRVVRVLG